MTMTRPTSEQVTHNGQILKDVLGPVFNVLAYGAKGDGVTDDFDALINAFNAVKAAGGGTLYIPITANGYYLRYGTFCNLSGASNIAIVSDGATLKLQGGTALQTTANGVFTHPCSGVGVSNLLIRGIRFEAASTVTRYQNGGADGAAQFDPEVVAGRANILEQASFRNAIFLCGQASNVTISDCYFGTGLNDCVVIKNAVPQSKNVFLNNLVFEGINQNCMFPNNIDHLVISNIVSRNKQGCRFDHFIYALANCSHVQVSNVSMRNDVKLVQGGGINLTDADNLTATNIHIENLHGNGLILGDNGSDYSLSNIVIKNTGTASNPAFRIRDGITNLAISNLVMKGCPWAIFPDNGTNAVIDNFVIDGATSSAINVGGGTGSYDIRMSNGVISDSGGTTGNTQTIRMAGSTGLRKLKLTNVDFVYQGFVPTLPTPCINATTSAANFVELDSCSFQSLAGTSSGNCVSGNTDTLIMRDCWQTGFASLQTTDVSATRISSSQNGQLTLTANSATPSVASGDIFITANTTATALTNFTGGVPGQEIWVLVNDANTTFDFTGTSLKGNDGVDYAASSGDVIFAKRIGSNWHCTISQG